MDLLEEYFEEEVGNNKIVLSVFFEEKNDVITRFCNNIRPQEINLNLQEVWEEEVKSFSLLYPKVKVCLSILLFTL